MSSVTIDTRTGISLGLVALLISGVIWAAKTDAQVQQNKQDIQTTLTLIKDLTTNLTKTNNNVIKLNIKLEQLEK